MNAIPPPVDAAVRSHLDALDVACPARVVEMHLTGSVALGDYKPEASDIDAVCVVEHPLEPPELDALRGVHERHHERHIDTVYLTSAELGRPEIGRRPPRPPGPLQHGSRLRR